MATARETPGRPATEPHESEPQHRRAVLVEYLGATMGSEAALEAIDHATAVLGVRGATVTRAQALAVFEHIAQAPGLLGITARLAKSRFRARTIGESRLL